MRQTNPVTNASHVYSQVVTIRTGGCRPARVQMLYFCVPSCLQSQMADGGTMLSQPEFLSYVLAMQFNRPCPHETGSGFLLQFVVLFGRLRIVTAPDGGYELCWQMSTAGFYWHKTREQWPTCRQSNNCMFSFSVTNLTWLILYLYLHSM
jgi:hypothetical protein